jgi:hypothetical protein
MQKSIVFLVIVGAILASGVFLSFYGAHLSTKDLTVKEDSVLTGDSLKILAELDPSKSNSGVFVVQILDFKEGDLTAKISDPLGDEIVFMHIDRESFEERFEILSKGTYQLEIENSGLEDIKIVGVIGHMPDNTTISVGVTGFYFLIIGLIGIVGVGIYAIRNRRR